MTLHTDVHLPLRTQTDRIEDGRADRLHGRLSTRQKIHMPGTRTVAALAVDARGQVLREAVLVPVAVAGLGKAWIAIMAEHAGMTDPAAEIVVAGMVVPRTHPPTLPLGIPAHRQLPQHSVPGQVQIGPRMIAGTHDVGHLQFEDVLFPSLSIQLVASLVELAVALNHPVVAIGRCVKEVVVGGVVLDDVPGGGPVKGTPHGHLPIAPVDFGVTGLTGLRIKVLGSGILLRSLVNGILPNQDDAGSQQRRNPQGSGEWRVESGEYFDRCVKHIVDGQD